MTIEKAERIRDMLVLRSKLKSELEELEKCKSITTRINDGANGISRVWEQDSMYLEFLKIGLKNKIDEVERAISAS